MKAGGSTTDVTTTGLSWTAGSAHHLATVYDGANMIIYWYGAQENTSAKPGSLATNNEDLTIGRRADATQPFDGTIDDVRVS